MKRNGFRQILGLITIKKIDDIRNKVNRAKNNPIELTNLLCKDFNVRMTSEEKWLTYDTIENLTKYDIEELRDSYAVGGVDLSSTTDLTCATIIIEKLGIRYTIQQYFIPEANIQEKIKEDKIPYDLWERNGFVTLCEGAKVNYSDITKWFRKIYEEYDIHVLWIGYDPWNAQYWVEEMQNNGFNMVEVRQGARTMSNPMKQLEADLIQKTLNYNNNPVLKWCLGNTSVKRDENDNIRPVKRETAKSKN